MLCEPGGLLYCYCLIEKDHIQASYMTQSDDL